MVGIRIPAGREVAVAALDDGAISTSSIAVHRWRTDAGHDVHHLIDPRNGEPEAKACGGDGGRPGPRLGRGLVQDAVPGWVPRHRRAGPRPRAGRLVGPGGRSGRDDAGRTPPNGLAGIRGLTYDPPRTGPRFRPDTPR